MTDSTNDLTPFSWRLALKEKHVLLLIRHGETLLNVENRVATTTDVPLSELGRRQAMSARPSLAGVELDGVFCSPMSRAIETAELILPGTSERLVVDPRLREPPAGPFEGEDFDELWGDDHPLSVEFKAYMRDEDPITPEGAESAEETARVVQPFLDELGVRPGRYVAFSHGGLIRIIASIFAGNDPSHSGRLKVQNCHAVALKWYPKPPHQVLAVNLPPAT